jgi:hypothetical protein
MVGAVPASSAASGTHLLMLALVKCTYRSSIFSVLYLQQVSQYVKKLIAVFTQLLTCGSQNEQYPHCTQM